MFTEYKFMTTLILCVFCACSNKMSPLFSTGVLKSDAVLRWTGDYAADGCGFFMTIDDHEYKPENESIIDDGYKSDSETQVVIEYRILSEQIEFWCGEMSDPLMRDGIRIISIQKKPDTA